MAASSLLPNPIFRSGEECRHSNLNNPQDIAERGSVLFAQKHTILTASFDWVQRKILPVASPSAGILDAAYIPSGSNGR